ncbi:hypothetical protein [Kitasatospora sp. NPDC088783]|uniref:hypothetical protein n=1 Tax=Kitasatospora sp. NPDC088783 TaxID=3364077 RepID=UPI003801773E
MPKDGSASHKSRARALVRPDRPYTQALQLRDARRAAARSATEHPGFVVQFEGVDCESVIAHIAAALAADGARVLTVHLVQRAGRPNWGAGERPAVSAVERVPFAGPGELHEMTIEEGAFHDVLGDGRGTELSATLRGGFDVILVLHPVLGSLSQRAGDLRIGVVEQVHLPHAASSTLIDNGRAVRTETPLTAAQAVYAMHWRYPLLFGFDLLAETFQQHPDALIVIGRAYEEPLPALFREQLDLHLAQQRMPVLGHVELPPPTGRRPVLPDAVTDPGGHRAAAWRSTADALHAHATGEVAPSSRRRPRYAARSTRRPAQVVGLLPADHADIGAAARQLADALADRGARVLLTSASHHHRGNTPHWPSTPVGPGVHEVDCALSRTVLEGPLARARTVFDTVLLHTDERHDSALYLHGLADTHVVVARALHLPTHEPVAAAWSEQGPVHLWIDRHWSRQGRRDLPATADDITGFTASLEEEGHNRWGGRWPAAAATWQPRTGLEPRQPRPRLRPLSPAAGAAVLRERYLRHAGGPLTVVTAGLLLQSDAWPDPSWLAAVHAEMDDAGTPLLGLLPLAAPPADRLAVIAARLAAALHLPLPAPHPSRR